MCHGLAEVRVDTVQDNVYEIVVSHLGTVIESINVLQVLLDGTCLWEIPDLVKALPSL